MKSTQLGIYLLCGGLAITSFSALPVMAQSIVEYNVSSEAPQVNNVIEEDADVDKPTTYAQLIDGANHSGKQSYQGSFTCSPKNGKTLNVNVLNKKDTSQTKVNFSVTHVDTGTTYGPYTIEIGKQKTIELYMPSGAGVSGDFEVYVSSPSGGYMDILVNARQF